MSHLDKILKKPENEMADADHMNRKDISGDEFDRALSEIAKKFKDVKPTNKLTKKERKERSDEILKALNDGKNPY